MERKVFVAMVLKRPPWTPMMLLQFAMNSQCFEICTSLLSWDFTPCQYTSAITIKPKCLTHSCVEQVFLYAWMCYTSWFELHISQDKCLNSYHLATILLCQPVRVGSVGGVCLTRAIQLLWLEKITLWLCLLWFQFES